MSFEAFRLIFETDYVVDAAFQGLAYYTMSAITNEPFKLARMAAYYKGIQSAGAAVSFGMDAVEVHQLQPIALGCTKSGAYR